MNMKTSLSQICLQMSLQFLLLSFISVLVTIAYSFPHTYFFRCKLEQIGMNLYSELAAFVLIEKIF